MKRKKFIIIALTITIAVLAAMFFFLKPFIVVGESMFPAFPADERLVAETLSKYFLKIKRGETIVFREPHERKEIFVKRVIGLPGETVRLADNSVTIISSDGIEEIFGEGTLIGGKRNGDPMEMKLGPEDYFVMGDNREKSTDSRHFGTVQLADIVGRSILRGFPAKILFSIMTLGEKTPPQAEGAYTIGSSLRFNDDDSAYLSRTPSSAGNRKTWTYSLWLKRGSLSSINYILAAFSNSRTAIRFNATNSLLFTFESGLYDVETNALFRDPSAYLHLVVAFDTTQSTASNRVKFYINGSQVTSLLQANYPAQNYESDFNNNVIQKVGADITTTFDGLMSEINFIDGQALTPASFGVTDGNGYWRPKAYSGTYGTNGFYLPFNDGTNTTTLGYDRSGNGNNYTLTNLATTDQMTDTPTNNYATLNPLDAASTLSDGNLRVSSGNQLARSTFWLTSGKWYWELLMNTTTTVSGASVTRAECPLSGPTGTGNGYGYLNTGEKTDFGANYSYGSSFTNGDVIGVAFDADTRTIWFSKNGTWQNGATAAEIAAGTTANAAYTGIASVPWSPSFTSNVATANGTMNFGQRPFTYTPPTGFKSLNTANLPEPTIVQPNKYFTAVIYAGTGAVQSITGNPPVVTFTSSGTFTVPTGVTSVDYLVVGGGGAGGGYTSGGTAGGGGGGGAGGMRTGALSVTPGASLTVTVGAGGVSTVSEVIRCGNLGENSVFGSITSTGGGGGAGRNCGTGGSGGSGGGGYFDTNNGGTGTSGQGNNGGNGAQGDNTGGFGDGIGGGGGGAGAVGSSAAHSSAIGGNGGAGAASSIPGSSVTYAGGGGGKGNTNGTGGSGGGGNAGTNGANGTANTGGGGGGGAGGTVGNGGSGIVIISYILPTQTIKFQPDLVWLKDRTSANAHGLFDSVRAATKYLSSNSTAAETTDTDSLTAFLTNGFSIGITGLFNTSGNSYISWNWKKSAISGFDIVSYTGDGTASRNISHNLGANVSFITVKRRDSASDWWTWHWNYLSGVSYIGLNTLNTDNTANSPWGGSFTNSVFQVTNNATNNANASGGTYIAYLFAEVPGFSRIGKYTGNGSADGPFIWTGFKPRWVMIKRTDSTGGWLVYDNARQTYNVNDNCLQLADVAAEANPCGNAIDVLSNGFKSRSTGTSANASGGTYIYAAFAEAPFKYSSASSASSGAVFFLGMSF